MSADYRSRGIEAHGELCEYCGTTERIVVHHRDGDRSNNSVENLIPLCLTCHAKVHNRDPEVADLVRELGVEPSPGKGTDTTIPISHEAADALYTMKRRRETWNDLIWRLIRLAVGEGA